MGLGRFGGGADVAEFAYKAGAKVTVTDLASAQKLGDSISRLRELEDIEYHLGWQIRNRFAVSIINNVCDFDFHVIRELQSLLLDD